MLINYHVCHCLLLFVLVEFATSCDILLCTIQLSSYRLSVTAQLPFIVLIFLIYYHV